MSDGYKKCITIAHEDDDRLGSKNRKSPICGTKTWTRRHRRHWPPCYVRMSDQCTRLTIRYGYIQRGSSFPFKKRRKKCSCCCTDRSISNFMAEIWTGNWFLTADIQIQVNSISISNETCAVGFSLLRNSAGSIAAQSIWHSFPVLRTVNIITSWPPPLIPLNCVGIITSL